MSVVEEVRRDALGGMDRLLTGGGDETIAQVAIALSSENVVKTPVKLMCLD